MARIKQPSPRLPPRVKQICFVATGDSIVAGIIADQQPANQSTAPI